MMSTLKTVTALPDTIGTLKGMGYPGSLTDSFAKENRQMQEAFKQAEQTGSQTPLVREQLRSKIQLGRLKSGKQEMVVDFENKPKYELTPEEKKKQEKRKQRNRLAAKNSRQRKKNEQDEVHKDHTRLKQEQAALQDEVKHYKESYRALQKGAKQTRICTHGRPPAPSQTASLSAFIKRPQDIPFPFATPLQSVQSGQDSIFPTTTTVSQSVAPVILQQTDPSSTGQSLWTSQGAGGQSVPPTTPLQMPTQSPALNHWTWQVTAGQGIAPTTVLQWRSQGNAAALAAEQPQVSQSKMFTEDMEVESCSSQTSSSPISPPSTFGVQVPLGIEYQSDSQAFITLPVNGSNDPIHQASPNMQGFSLEPNRFSLNGNPGSSSATDQSKHRFFESQSSDDNNPLDPTSQRRAY